MAPAAPIERPRPAVAAAAETDSPPASAEPAPDEGIGSFDEAAESAFLAEARERGETVTPPKAAEPVEEVDPKALPPLNDLVEKIPAEVRDVLEDLFRARFVRVKQMPKRVFKS